MPSCLLMMRGDAFGCTIAATTITKGFVAMPKQVWQIISLLSAAIGLLILIGVVIGFVQQMNRGGEYGPLLVWAVVVLILLPTAYITRRLADR